MHEPTSDVCSPEWGRAVMWWADCAVIPGVVQHASSALACVEWQVVGRCFCAHCAIVLIARSCSGL
eukprot:3409932-Alexandrium_andersonii.AAC.1